MEAYGSIYAIIDGTNDFEYIGQTTKAVEKRFKEHTKADTRIGYAIRAHGKDMFVVVVLKVCNSKDELDYWERRLIKSRDTKHPNGYNLTDGGDGSVGLELTPEHRAKISAALKGRKLPPEQRARLSELRSGKPLPIETIEKMSAAQRGEKSHNYGKPLAPKISSKISEANRGYSVFKNLLRELDAHKLSYRRLAKLMGLSYPSVSAKMLGRLRFTERDKAKLVEIFGKPIEYLLERDETPIVAKTPAPKRDSPYKNLLAELDTHQLSYRRFAELMCLAHSNIARKMHGERNFTERDKVKLVEIFGKPIEYLLARDGTFKKCPNS